MSFFDISYETTVQVRMGRKVIGTIHRACVGGWQYRPKGTGNKPHMWGEVFETLEGVKQSLEGE